MTSFAARQTEICRTDRSIERIYFAARRAARRADMNTLMENIRSEKFQCHRRSPPAACRVHLKAPLVWNSNCFLFCSLVFIEILMLLVHYFFHVIFEAVFPPYVRKQPYIALTSSQIRMEIARWSEYILLKASVGWKYSNDDDTRIWSILLLSCVNSSRSDIFWST